MAGPDRILGGVGSKILIDNDRVRVWELHLEPGEDSDVHQHQLDYLLIQLEGDRIAVVPEPDSRGPYPDYLEADVYTGAVVYIERGGIETARNIGQQPYRELVIELKEPSGDPPG
jgi:beta-alanine degradation protein BauB